MTCPDHDLIVDYVDGMLDRETCAALERHQIACQSCRTTVAAERALIERMRGVPTAPGRNSDFMAGLLSLGDAPTQPMPIARAARKAPATLPSHAPAQYVSARKPVGMAALAVAGCLSAAVVAIHVPAEKAQVRMPTVRSQSVVTEAPVARVIGFDPSVADATRP